jgi:hypothetical protein
MDDSDSNTFEHDAIAPPLDLNGGLPQGDTGAPSRFVGAAPPPPQLPLQPIVWISLNSLAHALPTPSFPPDPTNDLHT